MTAASSASGTILPPSTALGAAGTILAGGQGPYLTSSQVRLQY